MNWLPKNILFIYPIILYYIISKKKFRMGLIERSKRILEIKREKRKKQRGEGKVDTKSEELREGSIGTIDGLDFTVLGRLVYDWGGRALGRVLFGVLRHGRAQMVIKGGDDT